MDDSIGLLLLIQVVLIALNAVFASTEIAVLSLNEAKLNKLSEQGNKKAKRLCRLTSQPAKFLATIQVAITLSGFLGSAFAADNFSEPLVEWLLSFGVPIPRATLDAIAVILITLILSYFTLIFGELVPKRLAMQRSEELALGISGLISTISTLFAPIVWLLTISTNGVLRLLGIDPNDNGEEVSEEEIRMMVDAGSEKGTIDAEEKEFIQNVFEFDDLTAGELATHRTDLTLLDTQDTDEEWASIIHESRHTRYPVCDGSPDHIIGILNAKEYFRLADKSRENVMRHAVRDAFFVQETMKADVLFRTMNKNHSPLAVVLDEYGGISGIITLNDLIEELVGKLSDDTPIQVNPDPVITKLSDTSYSITGNVDLRELEDTLNVTIHEERYDTLTGLVFDHLGEIPPDGETSLDVEIQGLSIHVSLIENHQIQKATITLP